MTDSEQLKVLDTFVTVLERLLAEARGLRDETARTVQDALPALVVEDSRPVESRDEEISPVA